MDQDGEREKGDRGQVDRGGEGGRGKRGRREKGGHGWTEVEREGEGRGRW